MTFEWVNFQRIADELADKDDEAAIRSAISRYYYAVFCSARLYLIECKDKHYLAENKNSNVHRDVRNILGSSEDNTEAKIGETLDSLRVLRNDADYDWKKDKTYFKKEILKIKKKSHDSLDSIEYLKNNPPVFL